MKKKEESKKKKKNKDLVRPVYKEKKGRGKLPKRVVT